MIPNTTEQRIPAYILAYARRRNRYCLNHISATRHPYCEQCKAVQRKPTITTNQILNSELLDFAAYLEYELSAFNLTIVEARYKLVEQYPECNCITGKMSVLTLIIPFADTLHEEIPTSPIREHIYA